VIVPTEQDPVAPALEHTEGAGVDLCFDAAGTTKSLETALGVTRKGGRIINVAIWEEKPPIPMTELTVKEIEIAGSIGYCSDFPATIALMTDGRLDPTPLISRAIALEDVVEHGLKELSAHRDAHTKILVHP
jgi:(R,R)-butanediol dehydrogenase/meso-butanediol dehydrogenase/diacetyl reductase